MTALRNSLGVVCAVAFILCCGVIWAAVIAPRSGFALAVSGIAPLSDSHAFAAEAALQSRDVSRAKTQSRAELSVSPVREDAWLRLAEADAALHGGVTTDGQDALSHSYDAAPFDLQATSPRLSFMLAHYAELSPGLTMSLTDELNAWMASPALRRRLASLAADPHTSAAAKAALLAALAQTSPA